MSYKLDQISRHVTSKPKASSSAPSKAASPVKTTAPDPMLEKQLNEALQALSIKDADIVNLQNQLQSALSELQVHILMFSNFVLEYSIPVLSGILKSRCLSGSRKAVGSPK